MINLPKGRYLLFGSARAALLKDLQGLGLEVANRIPMAIASHDVHSHQPRGDLQDYGGSCCVEADGAGGYCEGFLYCAGARPFRRKINAKRQSKDKAFR